MAAKRSQDQTGAKWKEPVSEKHLIAIAPNIEQWRDISPFLEVSFADEHDIAESSRSLPAQRVTMLRKWKQKFGKKATYKRLSKAFKNSGRQDLVDKISELLTEDSGSSSDEEGIQEHYNLLIKKVFIELQKDIHEQGYNTTPTQPPVVVWE